ncbi:DedA family protein [Thermoflavimicrobium dichotomicum]|uniref:Membrane protein DedA, SNARE-associated domain n=1 Tax=Thermoflavimicrobium dichotomicum TaxID=46223 RepID=A0A1I3NFK4_9BACL|nr:DedA family protein [Thermoflavimicrobium dichotomicum]SFJ08118.1 membrane protein DedA, SNARE-associated domain [Thermoflavimicrobium dichotomicum]
MGESLIETLLQYGYIGIFLFLVLGIVGLPLPDEIMMTFLGYMTSIGKLDLFLTFLSAFSGSVVGITVSYVLGIRLGYPFLKKYGEKIFITRRRLKITQRMFRKYGSWLLFIGYFIPGVRHVTAYIAGISQLPYYQFALFAYTGAAVWCTTFISLGNLLGDKWQQAFKLFHQYGMIALMIAAPIFILVIGLYIWRRKKTLNRT